MIEAMEAGRELDALIAEKVMGWENNKDGPTYYGHRHEQIWAMNEVPVYDCPAYSTDIAAAWEVVSAGFVEAVVKLDDGRYGSIPAREDWSSDEPKLRCGFQLSHPGNYYEVPIAADCIGDTAPHAICLAALKAVGYSV